VAPAGADDTATGAEQTDREDLLREANRLRAERRWADAERTYARVFEEARGSDEAYAATVAAASLRLERLGRPAQALELYERALAERPAGALAEEAALGVAECRRALGDAAGEAEALRRFLDGWPTSPMIGQVRARLVELESSPGP
jgi:tetratricopeptide (TPR) repeat protein